MKRLIFVGNLPDTITEADLRDMLRPAGEVEHITLEPAPLLDGCQAWVTMAAEKAATRARNSLNGHLVGGRHIAVTPPDLGERNRLNEKQQKVVEQIAATLGETEEVPLRQLNALVMLCGTNFAEALLQEALQVEAAAGLLTVAGDRRRTRGGVFFYLARHRIPKPIRAVIYNRKGRLPAADTAPAESAAGE
ncbi:MAG: hypothetical protein MUE40_13915 [Anaerolineae bacterium]|jgi:hypothetical protein|nr:hypothetical protein [Anaerolineae bacterium]